MAASKRFARPNRRTFVKQLGFAPLLCRAAPFFGEQLPGAGAYGAPTADDLMPLHESRVQPHYPARSPLADVLRLVEPGSDEYITERYALELALILKRWSDACRSGQIQDIASTLHADLQASPFIPSEHKALRTGGCVEGGRSVYPPPGSVTHAAFLQGFKSWLGQDAQVQYANLQITSILASASTPITLTAEIRYEVLTASPAVYRTQRIGVWKTTWAGSASVTASADWKLSRLEITPEAVSTASAPVFVDVTQAAFGKEASYRDQLIFGSDHWRSLLDSACGIDIYGNNGVAVGDFDQDGHDDVYVSQPAGLPNRLYRNRGDGTFEDVTDKAGVGVLDNTSCSLFADLRNSGLQDLVVVCGSGPLLFLNQGDGSFRLKPNAFQFAASPQGTFTHAAIADYDLDGKLDIYFCVYSYYLGLEQYHYPIPYFDARNGPPNFLFHNQGDGTFTDITAAAGLSTDNDRYSFACAWGQAGPGAAPDLYVVNDFGRNVLYRNDGKGKFIAASTASRVEEVGAGMSAAWADTTNDERQDLYAANMWSAAGQRVSGQAVFQPTATAGIRDQYKRHAGGNTLYRNEGENRFRNAGAAAGVEIARWAWCSDFWDFDQDGFADLYVTNGYITAPDSLQTADSTKESRLDLGSFFWRQVVGKSPNDSTPSLAYEHGWNALNELIRSDYSWSGQERNVFFANNHDGTFSDVSGVVGLDLIEDGRSFALADFDGDGRVEVLVKNRNGPQLRLLHNNAEKLGESLTLQLRGTRSNRDAIGAAITVERGTLHQTKYLQAGTGFLAQHSKRLSFGLGTVPGEIHATVHWPSGLVQHFASLPPNCRITLVEGEQTISAEPFAKTAVAYRSPAIAIAKRASADRLDTIATWLIDPLKAPAFSLPDQDGALVTLDKAANGLTLLSFGSLASAQTQNLWLSLQQHDPSTRTSSLRVMLVVADQGDDLVKARAFLAERRIHSPVLFATEEVLGIYNIIYRYLFDRRRDLPLPCSFLVDGQGMIVKVYQGSFLHGDIVKDVQNHPATSADRALKALPFAGKAYQADFRRNDFTYGVAMFQHGYLAQAEESFQQVVDAHPDDAEGFYNLGTLSLRRNDFPKARTYLQRTLKIKPDYAEAWNNLGMMAAQEGRAPEAIDNFQQSLKLKPGYTIALLNLGNVYRRQGDSSRAKDALTRALALQPDDPEVNYSLGMFHAQQNQVQAAEDYLQRAVALRPDYPEALNNLGVLFVRKGDNQNAEQQFETCIRLSPSFSGSYFNLARLYVLQKRTVEAKAILKRLLLVHPEDAAAKQALDQLNASI